MIDLNAQFAGIIGTGFPKTSKSAQKYLDSQVLKDTDKYVPIAHGYPRKVGNYRHGARSGEIEYSAPYARRVY